MDKQIENRVEHAFKVHQEWGVEPLDDQEISDAIDDLEGREVSLSRSLGDCGDVGRLLHCALIELQARRGRSVAVIDVDDSSRT